MERWGKDNCSQQPDRKGEEEKARENNIGIAANLIKMLVVCTYGLHYGIRLTVVTPIGLDQRFLADGGAAYCPAAPQRPRGQPAGGLWQPSGVVTIQIHSHVLHQLVHQFGALGQAWSVSK